ncbi:hypothetical protein ACFZCY_21075 [Streptomyces sp. NPDC007983]
MSPTAHRGPALGRSRAFVGELVALVAAPHPSRASASAATVAITAGRRVL